MAGEFITQEVLAAEKTELSEQVNGDLCPTEFEGPDLDNFMSQFVTGDRLLLHPIQDSNFFR